MMYLKEEMSFVIIYYFLKTIKIFIFLAHSKMPYLKIKRLNWMMLLILFKETFSKI